jgi:hypothetical protein
MGINEDSKEAPMSHKIARRDVPALVATLANREGRGIADMAQTLMRESLMARSAATRSRAELPPKSR